MNSFKMFNEIERERKRARHINIAILQHNFTQKNICK